MAVGVEWALTFLEGKGASPVQVEEHQEDYNPWERCIIGKMKRGKKKKKQIELQA